ncbi:tRNA (adenosine(37)-N6)-dimethylallyltransferase MiaA [Tibeticola sp.]|uniref:tRNA (adenosine(37)-N6)-dimethylallyltransferase MiaA n=1 Tax=Tibeticola sp. TaxID=2005368 RepID=UPI0025F74227|nr:tRNA (adenosine(37)-N6)-dimethylallyltransferase MiaA [Tibeticola sp.]
MSTAAEPQASPPAAPPAAVRALCLAGPTASGKTAAALAIAARWPVEIVSVDSALVYRGMDVGTAKPSAEERRAVPHHLINIRDPAQAYSAAEFVRDAQACMAAIAARGRIPLLVGGTMLYFKALLDGLDALPAADAAVRAALDAQAREQGWPALHAELARVDPATAARLSPNDSQRIQRALEIWRVSGQPMSALMNSKTIAPSDPLALGYRLFSLEPADRGWLHGRIAERFDAMLAHGLLDEVRALRARGDLRAELPSMRCVGYRQAWAWLDAQATTAPPLAALREQGVAATRQLAKRQLTWLRGMPAWQRIPADAPDALDQLLRAVARVMPERA